MPDVSQFTDEVSELGDLLELITAGRPAWHADAACREHPDLDWFPGKGESTRAAKRVCAGCLVREECFAYGHTDKFGIWGGLSVKERRALRRAAA